MFFEPRAVQLHGAHSLGHRLLWALPREKRLRNDSSESSPVLPGGSRRVRRASSSASSSPPAPIPSQHSSTYVNQVSERREVADGQKGQRRKHHLRSKHLASPYTAKVDKSRWGRAFNVLLLLLCVFCATPGSWICWEYSETLAETPGPVSSFADVAP